MADAFISYRRDPSAPQALLIQTKLHYVHQIDAYVDTTRTDSTRVQFPQRLMQAIADAPTFILLLGDTTLDSEWVKKEIQRAYELQKHCIPIFQESYKPTGISDPAIDYVLNFEGVKLFDRQNVYVDEAINRVANYVLKASDIQNQPIITLPKQQISIPPKPKIILPQPFDWCYIPAGQTILIHHGSHSNLYIKQDTIEDMSAFWMARYAITNRQYLDFIIDDGYQNNQFWTVAGVTWRIQNYIKQPKFWDSVEFNDRDNNNPVVGISWYEAVAFCRWLSFKSSRNIMLPTDSQWQRAAQGDDNRDYPWGKGWRQSSVMGELMLNSAVDFGSDGTESVDWYEEFHSPFEIVNMAGNVWELCLTSYTNGTNEIEGYNSRIARGGSWRTNFKDSLKTTYRLRLSPEEPDDRRDDVGFRIACQID